MGTSGLGGGWVGGWVGAGAGVVLVEVPLARVCGWGRRRRISPCNDPSASHPGVLLALPPSLSPPSGRRGFGGGGGALSGCALLQVARGCGPVAVGWWGVGWGWVDTFLGGPVI